MLLPEAQKVIPLFSVTKSPMNTADFKG